LRDLPLIGGLYTWSNNQKDPTLERLDRVLISPDWENCFPLTNLKKDPRVLSDHNPLILRSDLGGGKKAKQFCFETSWLKYPEYTEKISEIWNREITTKNAMEKWCIKMNRVKKFLKGWGQNIKGRNRRYKNILKNELTEIEKKEEEENLTVIMLRRKNFIQTELWRVLEEEEIYWHKRSNQNWLLQGDNNTEYFHRFANGKKRKNMIFQIDRGG
jgi:hypothetical protein